ncbi:ThuA domain-containing protein [Pelagibacterium halotolerans]|uniref:Secreted glycosyl hydrolase n=1 Tax=Pelagibacterium halotolerans (strain DSM 22347 / JCM 15775 / CGMCC 1.7692 / B2) TaxID=1082931 RepID=G4R6M2_PELHB|nr:ThuA domain-containing protein [Pelagibacterium halotolerans]AEQ51218.1 secreted glycosyl hydrolase [Pelagibacterium halotolerans B2]QJR18919.1 ThuA domain-containing protein [Pelagibacterium halotolerans]SEA68052.1 hypothetical protein SAMN05428936_106103 [Pelagibacterium halotolerans]
MNVLKLIVPAGLALSALVGSAQAQMPESYTTFEKYGVCGSIDDSCYNDWTGISHENGEPYKVLIYHYAAPGLAAHDNQLAGVAALTELFEAQGYEVTSSNDPEFFENARNIRGNDAVVFFSTTRETLTDLGKHQLMLYVRGGGGFVGVHNVMGTSYSWTWFEGLVGGQLFNHGPRQEAEIVVHSETDPSVAHLETGTRFIEEEWYNVYPDPRRLSDIRVLVSVNEDTMESQSSTHPGMGEGHPVTWCHYYDGGRAWTTTLGHSHEILEDDNFLLHVLGGVDGVMGKAPFCQE